MILRSKFRLGATSGISKSEVKLNTSRPVYLNLQNITPEFVNFNSYFIKILNFKPDFFSLKRFSFYFIFQLLKVGGGLKSARGQLQTRVFSLPSLFF